MIFPFGLAVTVSLPCCPGSWSPAAARHSTAQPRCPGWRAGWRRWKRRCCHLLEPPAMGERDQGTEPPGIAQEPRDSAAKTELHKQHAIPRARAQACTKMPTCDSQTDNNFNCKYHCGHFLASTEFKHGHRPTLWVHKHIHICLFLKIPSSAHSYSLATSGDWLFHNLHIYETFFEELQVWTKSIYSSV